MNNCSKNCRRDKIGKWYNIVKKNLTTENFFIRKSSFQKKTGGIYDIRLNTDSGVLRKFNSVSDIINTRVTAENKLHDLYLNSAKKCHNGNCARYSVTSIYLNFRYNTNNWDLQCEKDEFNVGLCGDPILHYAAEQLSGAIREAKLLHENSCCLAVHLGLTFNDTFQKSTHANTLFVNTNCKTISHFEPQGKLIHFNISQVTDLQYRVEDTLSKICKEIGYKYTGYMTPNCNFQDDNPEFCYLWTTWVELLAVLNPWIIPKNITKYLEYRYKKLKSRSSRGELAVMFAMYLREI